MIALYFQPPITEPRSVGYITAQTRLVYNLLTCHFRKHFEKYMDKCFKELFVYFFQENFYLDAINILCYLLISALLFMQLCCCGVHYPSHEVNNG